MDIRILKPEDVSQSYVNWMEDQEIIKYSDNQYREFSLDKQIAYVEKCYLSKNIDLYGIFINSKHIGNILLNDLLSNHKRAEITYLIGNKNYWGKGIGYKAVSEVINKAKNNYDLNKIYAGVAKNNLASRRILEKNNFKLEGTRKKHLFYNNSFFDQLDFGLLL